MLAKTKNDHNNIQTIFLWISYQKKTWGTLTNFVEKNVMSENGDEITRFDGTVEIEKSCCNVPSIDSPSENT